MVGVQTNFRPINAKNILGMTLETDAKALIISMMNSAIAKGVIPDRSEGSSITLQYQLPDVDISDLPTVYPCSDIN